VTVYERQAVELAKRVAILSGGALVGFRGFCLALSPWAGDNPFPSMTWRQLLAWALDPAASGKVVIAAVLAYGFSYVVSRKLSPIGLTLWAVLIGGYLAVIVTVDLITKVDELGSTGLLGGPAGAILKVVTLAVLLPMAIALTVRLTDLAFARREA
jgi:hypothetical protein